jgi:thymidylate synthase (FAD)
MTQSFEEIRKTQVEALDQILGKPFHVLDDGFIRVIDYMGSDASIVQAARVSYGEGTKKIRQDRELIRYLMRHHHTSPFEMCDIKLHIRVPMDTWRQWIRHRTASVNEYSTRYSVAIDSAMKTHPDEWRLQSTSNRQGSKGKADKSTGETMSRQEEELHAVARRIYNERLDAGIAREQARKDLPLSTYTEAYWKIDLNNLLHFLRLRMDEHAQHEIRSYAHVIGYKIVKRWCPLTWEAFLDYRMNSVSFSRIELEILKYIGTGKNQKAIQTADECGWLPRSKGKLKSHLERSEFEKKLKKLGLPTPWKKPT